MCHDISTLDKPIFELLDSHGVKSTLQCIIHQNNEVKLLFGFDVRSESRNWKPEEASTLLYITQILGGHLLKGVEMR